jgi:adenylate cyclase
MPLEIERKFLATPSVLEHCREGVAILQGYLYLDPCLTVRARKAGARAFLTWKGKKVGSTRLEYELEIASALADFLLALVGPACRIEKTRYAIAYAGRTWEVDVFAGANEGLILAEVELDSPHDPVAVPPWIGREVTNDPRFRNSKLIPMATDDQRSGFATDAACTA